MFKKILNKNIKGGFSLKIDSPSFIPLVVSNLGSSVAIVCDKNNFNDVYSSFKATTKNCVGVPYLKKTKLKYSLIKTHEEDLFQRASSMLSSSPDSIFFCVVDDRAIDAPLVCSPSVRPFPVGGKNISFNLLVLFLEQNGYVLKNSVKRPGDYVIRGAVVDVFSFGEEFPFRLGFFGDTQSVVFFNSQTGNIIKSSSNARVYPLSTKGKLIPFDFNFFKIKGFYKNGQLFISLLKNYSGAYWDAGHIKNFSFDNYKKNKVEHKSITYTSSLVDSGCMYRGRFFFPLWYSNDYEPLQEKPVPLSKSMSIGSYYIHDSYGVCVFGGLASSDDSKDEKIILKFSDGKILLSVNHLYKISFYAHYYKKVSLDSLTKRGNWIRRRGAAKKQAEAFVGSLVKSYIQRKQSLAPALVEDKEILALFLSEFPHIDTPDQSLAWKKILKDLLSGFPMHRLLCGDVGFGKTELGIRAAFVVALNKKQTIVLAPTTILCKQLKDCFAARLGDFGISVQQLSRLSKNKASSLVGFLEKKIDVLVSTHSILNSEDSLSAASLFIVDEEHRFGVEQKEKIFKHSPGCHYLSLSATPIPRTLQLSLSKIRKTSLLLSPPKERKKIITNAYYFNKTLLKAAISHEIQRDGQVFIVDNSVNNLVFLAKTVRSFFPGLAVDVLYGSQDTKTIKKTMSLFRLKKIAVLISTVIIESGIDIPSSNTIIINNAHMFGLSQLHQLRGRVGRSSLQAYAYLFFPNNKKITPAGFQRISSFKNSSNLGSGYSLSLKDLEIRGSGNVFGYKQTGKNDVGFEYYSKLLDFSVKKINNPSARALPVEVLVGSSFIPSSFIPKEEQRSYFYKSISEINTIERVHSFYQTTVDLFGPLPDSFVSLFKTKKLSLLAEKTLIKKIVKSSDVFSVFFLSTTDALNVEKFLLKISSFFKQNSIKYTFKQDLNFLKIEFMYIKDDYYILLENFITFLYD